MPELLAPTEATFRVVVVPSLSLQAALLAQAERPSDGKRLEQHEKQTLGAPRLMPHLQ